MDKYGRQVGLSSGGSFGVRFAEYPVAVLRVAVVASNPAGLELVRIPSASLLFLLENSGVVVAGANEVYCEAVRSSFRARSAAWGPEFILSEVFFESRENPDALVPDLFRIATSWIMVRSLCSQRKMIGQALSPFQILKVLVLREYRRSCHHCDYNEEAKGLDHGAKYADSVPIAMQEPLRVFWNKGLSRSSGAVSESLGRENLF